VTAWVSVVTISVALMFGPLVVDDMICRDQDGALLMPPFRRFFHLFPRLRSGHGGGRVGRRCLSLLPDSSRSQRRSVGRAVLKDKVTLYVCCHEEYNVAGFRDISRVEEQIVIVPYDVQ